MWINVQWPLYQWFISLTLSVIYFWKVMLLSTISDDYCSQSPFLSFFLIQLLWHNLFFYINSGICLLCRKIIYVWDLCEREICLFNFLSTAAAPFSNWPRSVLSSISIFVINWFWWLLTEATAESHPLFMYQYPCLLQWHTFSSPDVPTVAKSLQSLQ